VQGRSDATHATFHSAVTIVTRQLGCILFFFARCIFLSRFGAPHGQLLKIGSKIEFKNRQWAFSILPEATAQRRLRVTKMRYRGEELPLAQLRKMLAIKESLKRIVI
jgi:hypothetical protein